MAAKISGGRAGGVALVAVAGSAVLFAACGFSGGSSLQDDEPAACPEDQQREIFSGLDLQARRPSESFEIAADEQTFVRYLGRRQSGGLFDEYSTSPVAIMQAADERPRYDEQWNRLPAAEDDLRLSFPLDLRVRLIDLPPGMYRMYSSDAFVAVFACSVSDG